MEKEKIDNKENKKEFIVIVLLLLTIIIGTTAITYAFFSYSRTGTNQNTITTPIDEVSFVYTGSNQAIKLENAVPLSVDQGKTLQDSYDFSIVANIPTSANINYRIIVVNVTNPTGDLKAIPNAHIRVYLTDGQNNPMLNTETYPKADEDGTITLDKIIKEGSEGILYIGEYSSSAENPNFSQEFKIKAWIDQHYDNMINADDYGTGVITSGHNYETDGKEVISTYKDRVYAFKIKVEADAISK